MQSEHKPVKWEKVYIFISSTFNDMHAERDFLVKKVFPQLAEWCERRKLRMVDIDLRWGVTEEDATRNRNVVEVCLNRIDECRPFFLCFLGQRYGWVPRKENISDETLGQFPGLEQAVDGQHSVTELEILHALVKPFHSQGLLEEKNYYPAKYAFFSLRDNSYLKDLPAEPAHLRRIYTDEAENDLSKRDFLVQKNKKLREDTVSGTERPVISYQATWSDKEQSPELAVPLQCPAVLDENIKRWRRQWQEAADVYVTGLDVAEDLQKEKKAREFNEKITQGRLTDFKIEGEPFDEVMLCSLKEAISERFPDHVEVEGAEELQSELDQQEQFLFINSEGFIEREGDFEQLDSYIRSDSKKLFVLAAPGGMGKTTLLANWIDRYHSRNEGRRDESIHFRFIGQSDLSTTVPNLLHYLLRELQEAAEEISASTTETRSTPDGGEETVAAPLEIPRDPIKLREVWPKLLAAAGQRGKKILVLDGLNQLESGLSDMRWLPSKLPENIKLVVSFKVGEETAEELLEGFREGGNVHLSEVKPFKDLEDRSRLVRVYLSQYLKELDEQHLEELIGSPGAENPLYLKVVLSELRVFGAFANLGEKVRKDFGDTPISAFDGILSRLERDPAYSPLDTEQSVPLLFGLLAHARHGLSADELASLLIQALNLKDNPETREASVNTVYLFLRQVRPFLARRDGRYDYFFESFESAAKKRYVAKLPDDSAPKRFVKEWHRLLANYFYDLPTWREIAMSEEVQRSIPSRQPTRRKVAELPYHLTEAEDWDRLEESLCDLRFIEAKCAAGMTYELILDYETGLDALPEAQKEKQKGEKREERVKKYTEEMIAYAKAWNDARVRHVTDPDHNPMPEQGDIPLPESIPSVAPWSYDKIREDTERIVNNPNRRDRMKAFSQFVKSESHALVKFAALPGFCMQQAYNSANSGPVVSAAERIISTGRDNSFLLRHPSQRPDYNPHPALLKSLETDPDNIESVSITWDGKKAVSGGERLDFTSYEQFLRIWNVESGECFRTLQGHTASPKSVSITPDAKIAVSGSGTIARENTLRMWDLESGKCLKVIETATKEFSAVSITPDGTVAVSGSNDKTLRVWDLESGQCLKALKGHTGEVTGASITPDGKRAVSGSSDRTLRVWDLESGQCLKALKGHTERVNSVSITPDGKRAVSGSLDRTLRIWNVETGKCLGILKGHIGSVLGVSITPDGRIAVSGSGSVITISKGGPSETMDNTLRVWDLESGKCLRIFHGHLKKITSVSVTPDGKIAISGSEDKTIRVWDLERGECPGVPDSRPARIWSVSLTPDGKKAVSAGQETTLRVWNLERGRTLKILKGHTQVVPRVSVTPDGKKAVSAGGHDKTLRVWDLESGKCLRVLKGHTGEVTGVSITPDSRRAVSSGGFKDDILRVWDLESGQCLKTLKGHTGEVTGVSITPDSRRAVSSGGFKDNILRVWDLESGKCLRRLKGHTMSVLCLDITPDGRSVLSGSADGTLRVWDIESGKCRRHLMRHWGPVNSVCVTRDGRKAISMGEHDYTLRVWNLQTGECLRILEGHTYKIEAVEITLDGRMVVSRSYTGSLSPDNTIRVWEIESGNCLAIYQPMGKVSSLSEIRPNRHFFCGASNGDLTRLVLRNPFMAPPITTPLRTWLYEEKRNKSRWKDKVEAVCLWCGQCFHVPDEILEVIVPIARDANLSPGQSLCLELHAEAWDEPLLLSECPLCHKPLKFNPFIVDNRVRRPWWKLWNR
jgi:WD40 repeat protein